MPRCFQKTGTIFISMNITIRTSADAAIVIYWNTFFVVVEQWVF